MYNWARLGAASRNCVFYKILCLLFAISVCHAILVNRTIDSNKGDPVTGFIPIYQPQSSWDDQTCSGCYIQPDISKAFDGTWMAATYYPELQNVNFTLRFTGVAIWIFLILSNANSHGPGTTNTQVNITFDGQYAGTWSHNPDLTTQDLIYNANIFFASGLSNTSHEVVVSTNDYPISTFINFDWAIYTVEVDTPASPSRIISSPTTTTNPASTPTNTSPIPTPSTTSSPIPTPPTTSSPIPTPPTTSSPIPTPPTTSSPIPTPPTTSSPIPTPLTTSSPIPTPPTTSLPILTPPTTSLPIPTPPTTSSPIPTPPTTSSPIPTPPTTSPIPTPPTTSPIPTPPTTSSIPTPPTTSPIPTPPTTSSIPTPPTTSPIPTHSTASTTLDPQAPPSQRTSSSISVDFPSTTPSSSTTTISSSAPTLQTLSSRIGIIVGCTLGGLAMIALILLFFVRHLLRGRSEMAERMAVIPHPQPNFNPHIPVPVHEPHQSQAARLLEARQMGERIQPAQREMYNLNPVRDARASEIGSSLAVGLPRPSISEFALLRNMGHQPKDQVGTLQAQRETDSAGLSDEPQPPAYSLL